jgi:PIN domain nuclease of toxin-antitoxin system
LGRLRFDGAELLTKLAQAEVRNLDVTFVHAERAAELPAFSADPFDRMLAARAICESCTLMTRNTTIASYGVATMPA